MVEEKNDDKSKEDKPEAVNEETIDNAEEVEDKQEKQTSAEEVKPDEEKKEPVPEETAGGTITEKVKEEIEPELTNEYKLPDSNGQKPLHHHSVKRILIAGAIVLVLALFAGIALWITHDDPVSTDNAEIVYSQGAAITFVEGDVEYDYGSGWTTVEPGTNLNESDSIRTLKASRTIITLDDGSAIRLNSDTTVTLTKLTVETVEIDNNGGEVYTRVTPSETRQFYVYVNDQPYFALGTAYRTINTEENEGVEVYHSKVKTKDSKDTDKEIGEGEAFYAKSKTADQVDKIIKLDIDKLKDDEFIKWNKSKDEAEKEFADKLGFLAGIDEPKEEEEEEKKEETAPTPAPAPNGITASGAKVSDGIKVSWGVKGIDTSGGFKIAYSTDDTTPSYGEDSAKYVSPGESSMVLGLTDGKVWHIRVCAYRGDGVCESYSNTISITAPLVEKEKVTRGTMTSELSGDTFSWSYTGKAVYGYKVVWNTSTSIPPTYPVSGDNAGYNYTSNTSINLSEKIADSGHYFVRVCAYTSGTETEKCVDYSTPTQEYDR